MCDLHKMSSIIRTVRRREVECPEGSQSLDSNSLVCIPSEGMKEVGVNTIADDFRCYLQCSVWNGQDVSDMCKEMNGDPFCRFDKKVDCGCMDKGFGSLSDDSRWDGYYTFDLPKVEHE